MPDLVIAFTVSGQREKYLRQSLDSWAKVRGVEKAHLVFCVEPARSFPAKEFAQWVSQVFTSAEVSVSPQPLGCLKNTRNAFESAFTRGARLAVMAEEDIVVSADVLEYLSWAAQEYEDDRDVAAICAHTKSSGSRDEAAVVKAPWFSPLICATWPDRWENFIRPGWKGWTIDQWDQSSQAWDTNLRHQIVAAGKFSVFPVVSRAIHVGEFSTWMTPVVAEKIFKDSLSDCFAPDHQAREFREVPFTSVPGLFV